MNNNFKKLTLEKKMIKLVFNEINKLWLKNIQNITTISKYLYFNSRLAVMKNILYKYLKYITKYLIQIYELCRIPTQRISLTCLI